VRAAYAWSCVPLVLSGVIWILLIISFGASLFMSPPVEQILPAGQALFIMILLLGKVILSIWSLVIYLNALAEVQKFSILRAIGNVIVSAIALGIALGILWFIFLHVVGAPAFIPILRGIF